MSYKLTSKGGWYYYELNICVKTATSQIWLIYLKDQIQEKSCVWVISRISNNKQVTADVVGDVKGRNKVWLMYFQGKQSQEMYFGRLWTWKTNIPVTADVFRR